MISTFADDQIALHYQPVAVCRSGDVVGLEALMRWHHRQRGAISPEAFIPIFEHSGLIVQLSRWALSQACIDAAAWANPLQVSVNLSAIQFDEQDLPRLIRAALVESGLTANRLELEMTEAALINDPDRAAAALRCLREIGVGIALDDFGTGNSAPSYLKDYPFSRIKIDARLVADIETSASTRSVIRMIIELTHALGISVAAKGVETLEQRSFLQHAGCDLLQGFLVGRPGPVADLAPLTSAAPGNDDDDRPPEFSSRFSPYPPLRRASRA